MLKQSLLFLLIAACCGTAAAVVDFCGKSSKAVCQDRTNCDKCYCSFKCGPRDKKPDDTLIWIEDDPNGIYCYCKQRDVDYFKKNGCDIKEATR